MRLVGKNDVADASNGSLWLVALVCFGPLTFTLLLGVLALPLWLAMLADLLVRPEAHAHDPGATLPHVAVPIAYVLSGLVGLAGLFRVLTLPRDQRPRRHRVFTIGMVAVGLTALLIFDLPQFADVIADFPAEIFSAATLVYVVLPFTGAVWMLSTTWRVLFAGPRK